MHRTLTALALSLLVLSLGRAARAEDPPAPTDEALARIAHRILQGEDGRTARLVAGFDEPALTRLFAEIRAQVQTTRTLDTKRVRGLSWQDADLDAALGYLTAVAGCRMVLGPRAREADFAQVRITLHMDDVSVRTVLDMITQPYGLAWVPEGASVRVLTVEELKAAEADDTLR